VREVNAIFDSGRLGYRSTLAAMCVAPARFNEVAAVVSAHPCVSHNYERVHEYNLWFAMTVGPGQSLEREIANLAARVGVDDYLILPALRRFKIGVDFDLGTRSEEEMENESAVGPDEPGGAEPFEPTPANVAAVRALQTPLPLIHRPFAQLAADAGMSEAALIAAADEFLASGVMRRYAAVLRHQHVGYGANAMVGWVIDEDQLEQAGLRAAEERAVSHCYHRPAHPPRWPYNLITMIHGQSDQEVREVVTRLVETLQPRDHALLFSRREFKKQRVRYFVEAADVQS
jgi:DNA-binding Lrp family transcriptional regulator